MNANKFATPGTIASAVTLLVSGWFLVAAGAILTDPPSVYTQRPAEPTVTTRFVKAVPIEPTVTTRFVKAVPIEPTVTTRFVKAVPAEIAPQTHETIKVVASRLARES